MHVIVKAPMFAALRVLFALLLPAAGFAHATKAVPPPFDACIAVDDQRVLSVDAMSPTPSAHAVWLDATHVRWPGKPASGRYRLHASADARLRMDAGELHDADDTFALEIVTTPLPAAISARFAHVGDGVTLALRNSERRHLDRLLRGQLVLVHEDADGDLLDVVAMQAAAALDARYAESAQAHALGVSVAPSRTRFAMWAPTARAVSVCVFGSSAAGRVYPLRRDDRSGIWSVSLAGDRSGSTYAYLVDVFVPGFGIVRNRVTDPYSISLDADSRRSAIAALDSPSMKPPGWDNDRAPLRLAAATDMMIYELHVRDFSINDASVSPPSRGKYLAFTETSSNGMRHLRALAQAGMTDLHLLPVFDIASIPETGCVTPSPSGAADSEAQQAMVAAVRESDCFNWGYDPWHYTAPEGSYSSDPHDPTARVRELRRLVQAVHGIGLRVGMDVVYNHTPASGQQRTSVLDRIVPGYYHRLDGEGRVERSTCCDNTATEHRMMAKLMIDSVIVWARDHHIDSFRFDLMGHQPRAVMLDLQAAVNRAAGRHVELIGEGWNFGEVKDGARFVQAAQNDLNGTGIATFSDRARDAVRGGGCCDSGAALVTRQGHVNGLLHDPNPLAAGRSTRDELLRSADLVRVGLAGSLRDVELLTADDRTVPLHRIDYEGDPAGYASAPGEVVNYVENHDNPTLFDINVLKLPPTNSREDRARVQILALATTAFSQGIAYFHAGVDILRSKSLDRNSFNSGDWFNRLDWTYEDNHFGIGLPPADDNAPSWLWLRPLLANAAIKPAPEQIAWTRDAFRDLLRIRASSQLFRLRTQAEVRERLRFHNTGSTQLPTVLAVTLDGRGLADAHFDEIAYFINVDRIAHDLTIASARAKSWQLHPLQRDTAATDARVRDEARVDVEAGRFHVPARTAVVFVVQRVAIED